MLKQKPILVAFIVFLTWMLATYLLEGYPHTFLNPDATINRIVYIIFANFLIGLVFAILAIKYMVAENQIGISKAGFRSFKHSAIAVTAGFILGISIYFLQDPPTTHPVIILNAYFQVLSVSIAEIIVCWALAGTAFEAGFRKAGIRVAVIPALIVSSILFGLYHYAHSPPFNRIGLVLFLIFIGIFTGIFFFISRDIYGTIIFHNFFGIKGVIMALRDTDKLSGYQQLHPAVLVTAMAAITLLISLHVFVLQRRASAESTY